MNLSLIKSILNDLSDKKGKVVNSEHFDDDMKCHLDILLRGNMIDALDVSTCSEFLSVMTLSDNGREFLNYLNNKPAFTEVQCILDEYPSCIDIYGVFKMLRKAASITGDIWTDGCEYIPKEGTWLLEKGECVVDRGTAKDLKEFLSIKQKG